MDRMEQLQFLNRSAAGGAAPIRASRPPNPRGGGGPAPAAPRPDERPPAPCPWTRSSWPSRTPCSPPSGRRGAWWTGSASRPPRGPPAGPVAGGHHPPAGRRHRQRRQRRPAGLLRPLPRLHRQRHPLGGGAPAPGGVPPAHGGPGPPGAQWPGQADQGLQPARHLRAPHGGAHRPGAGDRARTGQELASCYRACLELAPEHHLRSVAFCCISTGEFHFPNREAAEMAVGAVTEFLRQTLPSRR